MAGSSEGAESLSKGGALSKMGLCGWCRGVSHYLSYCEFESSEQFECELFWSVSSRFARSFEYRWWIVWPVLMLVGDEQLEPCYSRLAVVAWLDFEAVEEFGDFFGLCCVLSGP